MTTNRDRAMITGVADIVKRVKDKGNRKELAEYVMQDFKKENVRVERDNFMRMVGLDKDNG